MPEKIPATPIGPAFLSSAWTVIASWTMNEWAMMVGMIATVITVGIAIHRAVIFDRAVREHRAKTAAVPSVLCEQCPYKP